MSYRHVVVVLPGITGSVLSKDGKEVWGASPATIFKAIATGGESIKSLALQAPDDPNLDDLGDGVVATALAPDIHLIPGFWKIDGYSGLISTLVASLKLREGGNLFAFPYDWRRDNIATARKLAQFVKPRLDAWRKSSGAADAKLVLVCHSMGGLVARQFLEVLDGWKDTRALVTFGTPFRGSLNALGYLANGYAESIGPLKLDLTSTLKSFNSVYQLLPTFQCVDKGGGEHRRVGEMTGLPGVDAARARDALHFHDAMQAAETVHESDETYQRERYDSFPIVGVAQPTFQSARFADGRVTLLRDFAGKDFSGDGTVPRVSATPKELSKARREIYAAEQHGSLQGFDPALVNLIGVLTGLEIDLGSFRLLDDTLSVDIDDAYDADAVELRAKASRPTQIIARVVDVSSGALAKEAPLIEENGVYSARMRLAPGAYRASVTASFDERPATVNELFLAVAP